MRPGKRERQEFEYIRHGTQTLIASFDVTSGQVIQGSVGDTRTLSRLSEPSPTPDCNRPKRYQMALGDGLLKHPSVGISSQVCRSNRRT